MDATKRRIMIESGGPLVTIDCMSKQKSDKRRGDRHAAGRQMRIKQAVVDILDELARENETSAPQEAHRLLREGLTREGRWPRPKPKP